MIWFRRLCVQYAPMRIRTVERPLLATALVVVAVFASTRVVAGPNPPKPAPAAPAKLTPVGERAQVLREAADQLDKAASALGNGNKNLAEQLFSTAELLVGPDALASIAQFFREGAPPRITTPTIKVDPNAAPQPKVAGSSEAEDEVAKVAPPKVEGSLTGTM